ncbi:MAG: hypothetical protein V3T75_00675 [candidate division Zixibacteria bacterium]
MRQEAFIEKPAVHAVTAVQKKRRGFLKFPKSWGEVKKLGWKFVTAFILFYLIRDTILYIIIPYLIAKGIFF